MLTSEIQSDIETIEKNSPLYEEINFASRAEAIDYIELNVIDRIDGLLETIHPPDGLISLKQCAERVKRQLEDIDATLFQRLRANIRRGDCTRTAFKRLIDEYVGRNSRGSRRQDALGYDSLDVFVNGLLLIQAVPIETKARGGVIRYGG